jgi:hypothetical protein
MGLADNPVVGGPDKLTLNGLSTCNLLRTFSTGGASALGETAVLLDENSPGTAATGVSTRVVEVSSVLDSVSGSDGSTGKTASFAAGLSVL